MITSYDNSKTYFTKEELSCNCCGRALIDPVFKSHAKAFRHIWGKPMIVNSCCRCTSHNQKIGGHPRSLHLMHNPVHPPLGSVAWDIKTTKMTEDEIEDFISLAWELGWSLGVASNFIHMDRRTDFGLKQARYEYGT